jgi:hypothetical protein
MKLNTKTATPFNKNSPNSFIHDNAFIPANRQHDGNNNNDNDHEGRTILFETVIVSTPVLVSSRAANHDVTGSPPRRALLASSQVDDLSDMLHTLSIAGSPAARAAVNVGATPRLIKQEVDVVPTAAAFVKSSSSQLGRCEVSVSNCKTQLPQTVLRSARFMRNN